MIDGEPWFVGKEVAERLGYTNPAKAMGDHCRGVTKRYPILDALGRSQEARILHAEEYLRKRDPEALKVLPKVLAAKKAVRPASIRSPRP